MGVVDDKRRELFEPDFNSEAEDEEEEEALSLCDLPVVETNGDVKQKSNETQPLLPPDHDDHFEFSSWGGPLLTESEMCAAEDVFFQGQILPLRLSISSDNCVTTTRQDSGSSRNPSRCNSRSSESTEHCSSNGFTSSSSRSSSSRSHNSSSSSTPTTCNSTNYKPKERNLFHSHPSPKPQLWFSNSRPKKQSTRNRGSTIWRLFRPGLVQTPEIELQSYPKLRNNKSFNSSSSSVQSNSKSESKVKLVRKKKQRFGFESCKCSVGAIGTVSSRVVVLKNSMSDKKVKGREIKVEKEKEKEKKQKQRKEALYHRRTFEWLKELPIADGLDEANYVSRS